MAYVNASDLVHSIVAETAFGTTPTTGTRYELPTSAEQTPLSAATTEIASNTKRPNRASNGIRPGMVTIEGALDIRFQRHPFMDLLLESALSGTITSNVLKAGVTDSSFTLFTKYSEDSIQAFAGCMVSGFSINAKANGEVSSTWDIIGSTVANLSEDSELEVTSVTGTTEFVGAELGSISIAGLTLDVVELGFSTKLDRTRRPKLTSNTSGKFGINGTRETIITVKAYRPDNFTVETGITGLAQAISFDIGAATTGYRFQTPAAFGMKPKTTLGEGSAFVELQFKAAYDGTAGTDLVITKL